MAVLMQSLGAAFGNDKLTPVYAPGAKQLAKPLSNLALGALGKITPAADRFEQLWNAGTARQEGLMSEQEVIGRQLLGRRMGSNPTDLLKSVGDYYFNLINPNVVTPLAGYDAANERLRRRAAGINPAAIESTADRLRNARIASGRYYDVARTMAGLIPGTFNQVYNAGVNDADIAMGYIPQIMRGYRELDDASLAPIRERLALTRNAAGTVGETNKGIQTGVIGYEQKRNWADRLADADTAAWNNIKDVANTAMSIYGSLYGGGMLGGAGGGMGGMMGGGGGGGSVTPSQSSSPTPRFMAAPQMQQFPEVPAWAAPGAWNLRY